MVIISSQKSDASTCEVMDWLERFGVKSHRVNGEEFEDALGDFSLELNPGENRSLQINVNGDQVLLDDISSFWFRRSALDTSRASNFNSLSLDTNLKFQMKGHLNMEASVLQNAVFAWLDHKKVLGNYEVKGMNKLSVLSSAQEVGFDIPASLVTNSKKKLLTFLQKFPNLITKCLSEVRSFRRGNELLGMYTSEVNAALIKDLPESFYPSLFQENIQKDIELRVFYLNKEVYPMAIFSQLDQRTSTDFREYNHEKNNRVVPYSLPQNIRKQIILLMEKLNLNTGSVDIIKSFDKRYVFLEVNPVGQFGMVSKPCNYFLEKKIAKFLATT